jgi:kynurenine formamidase
VLEDLPYGEPCHRFLLGNGIMGWENVGGGLDQVVGMNVSIAGFPIPWEKSDGSMVRPVVIVDEGDVWSRV